MGSDKENNKTTYVTLEGIEKAGATVRGGKLRHAVQLALMAGPIKITK